MHAHSVSLSHISSTVLRCDTTMNLVCSFLDPFELLACALVSKPLSRIAAEEILWQPFEKSQPFTRPNNYMDEEEWNEFKFAHSSKEVWIKWHQCPSCLRLQQAHCDGCGRYICDRGTDTLSLSLDAPNCEYLEPYSNDEGSVDLCEDCAKIYGHLYEGERTRVKEVEVYVLTLSLGLLLVARCRESRALLVARRRESRARGKGPG